MSYLEQLKKNRGKSLDKLSSFVDPSQSKRAEKQEDDRFWQPTADKAGNAFAVIRFLPEGPTHPFPFVQEIKHNFNNPANKRFVNELCPTLFKQPCPICESNKVLWDAGNEAVVRGVGGKNGRKRIVKFISNILVVNDPANPENNGKVKLFRYGSQIFNKLIALAQPKEGSGDEAIDIFSPWDGANFKLTVAKVAGFPNYNESSFSRQSVLGTDEEIEAILSRMHDLSSVVSEKQLKSYDELKKRLDYVLNATTPVVEDDEEVVEEDVAVMEKVLASTGFKEEPVKKVVDPQLAEQKEEDSEVESYFDKLTEDE